MEIVDKFLHDYRDWIGQPDLKLFPHMVFSQGTTETFDKFYLFKSTKNHSKTSEY